MMNSAFLPLPTIVNRSLLSLASAFDNDLPDVRFMMYKFFGAIDKIHQRDLEILEEESKIRTMQRCYAIKEQLMMKAWHPSRVYRLLELGYAIEDM
jgi:hypothetical protein